MLNLCSDRSNRAAVIYLLENFYQKSELITSNQDPTASNQTLILVQNTFKVFFKLYVYGVQLITGTPPYYISR